MSVEDEVLVGRVGEQAGAQRHGRAAPVREVAFGEGAQQPLVFRVRLAPDVLGRSALAPVVVAAELEAGHLPFGQAVVAALLDLEVEHREAVRREEAGPARAQPGEHLPLRRGQAPQRRRGEVGHPRARRQHQPPGLVPALVRRDHDALAPGARFPAQHPLAGADVGAGGHGRVRVHDDRPLAQHEAALRLEHGAVGDRQAVAGPAGIHLGAGERFVR